jgi:mercuric ion transport protein
MSKNTGTYGKETWLPGARNDVIRNIVGSLAGAVTAGVGSAVCCSGPFVAAALGVSGAGLAAWRPYRPLFIFVAVGLLWTGFYLLDQQDEAACDPHRPCASPQVRRRLRIGLWASTVAVLALGTSARWLPWIV